MTSLMRKYCNKALDEASNSSEVVQIQYTDGDGSLVNGVVSGEDLASQLAGDQPIILEDGTYAVMASGDDQKMTYTIVNDGTGGDGNVRIS